MRKESVNLLKELMNVEIMSSLKEIVRGPNDINIIMKSIEVDNTFKNDIKQSFKDISNIIDDEVVNIVDVIDTFMTDNVMNEIVDENGEIKDENNNDEYWGG
jgi:hypothetical protein